MKINYQKELEKIIEYNKENNLIPKLLLHSCCAPCSSYVLDYLSKSFKITVFYYNPNIFPEKEYIYRVEEEQRFINEFPAVNKVEFIKEDYIHDEFLQIAKGLEKDKEGSKRCFNCYKLRLEKTAVLAKEKGYDYFTTTLSISPYKDSQVLNEIGKELSQKYNVKYLYSDFKKKEGFKKSIELSKKYNLYRQDYCGCEFSIQNKKVYTGS